MKLADFNDSRVEIFEIYKKSDDVKNDVSILREWMKKVPHIPSDDISDTFLEICLLENKWSIEKAKNKIENYCTLKAANRYSYLFRDIPVPSKVCQFVAPLPKLTKDHRRVIVSRVRSTENFELHNVLNVFLYSLEILARHEYSDGSINIVDFTSGIPSISLFRIDVLADFIYFALKAHSFRTKEIHIINKSANFLLNMVKPLFPPKLVSRMIIHDSFESLTKFVSAKYLPKDFGGELKSYDEFLADWDDIFGKNSDILKEYINTKALEELRQEKSRLDEMQGTFRKLDID